MQGSLNRNPEKLVVISEMLRAALSQQLAGRALFDQLIPDFSAAPFEGPTYDSGDPETGAQLLHSGTLLARLA